MVRFSEATKKELLSGPVDVLKKKEDIIARADHIYSYDPACQYRTMLPAAFAQEAQLVRNALESFSDYIDQQDSEINSQVESILTDPMWDSTKARRKVKNMRDLQAALPDAFKFMMGTYQGNFTEFGKTPSENDIAALQVAPLRHHYTVDISSAADGKIVSWSLDL